MAKDANFKTFIRGLIGKKISVLQDVTVGKLPLQIDLLFGINESENLTEIGLQPISTVYKKDERENIIIEYKSGSDNLEYKDLSKIHAYRHLLICTREYSINNTFPLIITTQTQENLFSKLDMKVIEKGIYAINYETIIYMIVVNELEVIRENFGLLFYSSGKKEQEFLKILLAEVIKPEHDLFVERFLYLSYVNKYRELNKLAEAEGIELEKVIKNRKLAICPILKYCMHILSRLKYKNITSSSNGWIS